MKKTIRLMISAATNTTMALLCNSAHVGHDTLVASSL